MGLRSYSLLGYLGLSVSREPQRREKQSAPLKRARQKGEVEHYNSPPKSTNFAEAKARLLDEVAPKDTVPVVPNASPALQSRRRDPDVIIFNQPQHSKQMPISKASQRSFMVHVNSTP